MQSRQSPPTPTADDADAIFPDDIARPLVASSFLMLITSVVSAQRGEIGLSVVTAILCATSVLHWYRPRFSSWRRHADLCAVAMCLLYGTFITLTRARTDAWRAVWFAGGALVGLLFTLNETLFYLSVSRTPTGASIDAKKLRAQLSCLGCGSLAAPTEPGTLRRRWVYRRAMLGHLVCVHVLANALSLVVVLFGTCHQQEWTLGGGGC